LIVGVSTAAALDDIAAFREEHPHIPVVAIVPEMTVNAFADVVRAGALVAVAEDAPPETIGTVLEAALHQYAAVPESVVRAMALRVPVAPDAQAWVEPGEAEWLRVLAQGESVADLAKIVGYSEREMFRTLRDLYIRIGVKNRTEAIVWATRHALLDEQTAT